MGSCLSCSHNDEEVQSEAVQLNEQTQLPHLNENEDNIAAQTSESIQLSASPISESVKAQPKRFDSRDHMRHLEQLGFDSFMDNKLPVFREIDDHLVAGYLKLIGNNLQIPNTIEKMIVVYTDSIYTRNARKFDQIEMVSTLLNGRQKHKLYQLLEAKLHDYDLRKVTTKLLYRHSENKNQATNAYRRYHMNQFHSRCDGKGSTVTIIKSNHGHIFGAFVDLNWEATHTHDWLSDDRSFLFLLHSSFGHEAKIIEFDTQAAVKHHPQFGPTFADGAIHIRENDRCSSTIRDHVIGIRGNGLCGGNEYDAENKSYEWTIDDYEVFQLGLTYAQREECYPDYDDF